MRITPRALSMNSGRSALLQSGMAAIFFSLQQDLGVALHVGVEVGGEAGSTSTVASALRKVSCDMV